MFEYPVLRSPWMTNNAFIIVTSFMWAAYTPLIAFGVAGTFVTFLPRTRALFGKSRADGIRFLALLHLFVIGVHVAGAPFARYSVPFRPVTFFLAVFLLVWLFRSYLAYRLSLTSGTMGAEQLSFDRSPLPLMDNAGDHPHGLRYP